MFNWMQSGAARAPRNAARSAAENGRAKPIPTGASRFSGAILFSAFCLIVFGALTGQLWVQQTANGFLCVYLAIEVARIARTYQIIGGILALIGMLLGWGVVRPDVVLLEGLTRTQYFIALFAGVAFLQLPAQRSPSLLRLLKVITRQTHHRQFLVMTGMAQAMGGFIHMAGLSLLAGAVEQQRTQRVRRRLAQPLLIGFATSACWSPFFVSMTVVLVVVPGVRWSELIVYGLALSVALNLLHWAMRRIEGAEPPPTILMQGNSVPLGWGGGLRLGFTAFSLLVPILVFVEMYAIAIPIAIALTAPAFSLLWTLLINYGQQAEGHSVVQFGRLVGTGLTNLRTETLLFTSANVFGAGVSIGVPPDLVANVLGTSSLSAEVAIAVFCLAMFALGALGVHPIISAVLVGSLFTPEVIGVEPLWIAVMLLAMWGINVAGSPLSPLVLYVARLAGVTPWEVAWRWCFLYGLLAALTIAGFVSIARALSA